MKKTTKIISAVLAGAMSLCLVACGGGGGSGGSKDNKNKTTVNLWQYIGCSGEEWMINAIDRFEEANKDKVYEAGKKGVHIERTYDKTPTLTDLTYDVYLLESVADIYALSAQGKILNLDDLFKGENGYEAVGNKIKTEMLDGLKGVNSDGEEGYYALPWYEWYPGITYDIDYFDKNGLYFADSESGASAYPTDYGTAYLLGSNTTKSVGPDGKRGTYDDGLPSSVEEFLQLCAVIKSKGYNPIVIGGGVKDYSFYLVEAIWAALSGADEIQTIYSMDSKGKEIEVVKRDASGNFVYKNESLYPSATNAKVKAIKVPETEKIVITSENANRIYDMVTRYYALSVLEVICLEKWYNESVYADTSYLNTQTQQAFYFGEKNKREGKTGAMLYDASFWYSEAVRAKTVEKYQKVSKGEAARQVSYMPMPTKLRGSVTENNGKKSTLLDIGNSLLFISSKITSDGVRNAAKDFLAFLFSDAELKAFTEKEGLLIPIKEELNYYDKTKVFALGNYYERLDTIRNASDIVYFSTTSDIVRGHKSDFNLLWSGPINFPQIGNAPQYYMVAINSYNATTAEIFTKTRK